jgi:hypothetical protein
VTAPGLEGEIALRDGEVASARSGPLEGEAAALAILATEEGTFRFSASAPAAGGAPGIRIAPLAIEALRRRDEPAAQPAPA